MVKVSVVKQSNYPVSATKIKKKLADFLVGQGIVSDAEVSIAIIGEKKMMELGKTSWQVMLLPSSPTPKMFIT